MKERVKQEHTHILADDLNFWQNFPHENNCKRQKEAGVLAALRALESKTMDSGEARPCSITEEVPKHSSVKSGKFGLSAEFGQQPCLFHILITVDSRLLNYA